MQQHSDQKEITVRPNRSENILRRTENILVSDNNGKIIGQISVNKNGQKRRKRSDHSSQVRRMTKERDVWTGRRLKESMGSLKGSNIRRRLDKRTCRNVIQGHIRRKQRLERRNSQISRIATISTGKTQNTVSDKEIFL